MEPRPLVAAVWSLALATFGCAASSSGPSSETHEVAGGTSALDAGTSDAGSATSPTSNNGFVRGLQYNGAIGFERAK